MRNRTFHFLLAFLFTTIVLTACKPQAAPTPQATVEIEPTMVQTLEVAPLTQESQSQTESLQEESGSEDQALPSSTPARYSTAVQTLSAELEGLSLEDFYEESLRYLTLRSPESVVRLGLTDYYGVEEVLLDDISDEYQRETYQLLEVILDHLESYDRESLSSAEKISYDVYKWDLQDQLSEKEFMYHDYPATYYPITAVHEDIIDFFTEIHPIRHVQDAHDYVTRLGLVEGKIDQLIDNLDIRSQAGFIPPQFAIQWAVYGDLGRFVNSSAKETPFYTALEQKMLPLSSGTPQEMEALLLEAEQIIVDEVLPAYQELYDALNDLETYAGGDSGVWRLPQGEAYYDYLLRHYTTTELSAEDIHQLGFDELERIHDEMRLVFDQLGYPDDISIIDGYDRVAVEGGYVAGEDVLHTYQDLITEADQNLEDAFDIRPEAEVIVIPDQYGDYYVRPAFDHSRPGAFYAGVSGSGKELYAMPTLVYHETIPGHHLQIALAMELKNLPSFRQGIGFTAFAEGWALYAERLAWELGWYEGSPYGHLGFLQAQAFRAARLVVDTGLHAMGWNFDQAQDFFTENTGFEVTDNVNPKYEIARYLVFPGQATAYYIGYLKFMELRQMATDVLGDQFDLKEFHRLVLSNGSLPLEILETVVVDWLDPQMVD